MLKQLSLMVAIGLGGVACNLEPDFTGSFVTQPVGGQNIQSLRAEFKGRVERTVALGMEGPGDVTVKLQWMTDQGEHKSEDVTFHVDDGEKTVETTFSAPPGMYLDKTFWVKASWPTGDGTGSKDSSKASCTVQ